MKSVAVCGSMDFFPEMEALADELRALGVHVELPSKEETKIDYTAACDDDLVRQKKGFIDQHLSKIRSTDCVLLANLRKRGIEGYIGANTLMEAAFAYALGKPIFVLNEVADQPCRPEVLGMLPTFLYGDLARLCEY